MTTLDRVTIALHFGLVVCLTWWSVARNRDSAEDYFLAGRDAGWPVVGASIFASNIGSEHLVGLAGAGATSGVSLAHFELRAWCLSVLGWCWCRSIYAVFFFGVFMRRLTGAGCVTALLTGFGMGVLRLFVVTPVTLGMHGFQNGYAPGSWLWILNNVYFQYYGLLIFVVSVAVLIVVSYATPPPREHQLTGLTYATVTDEQRRDSPRSWYHWDVINSAAVLRLIAAAYIYFNG